MMASGPASATLPRDTVYAAIMLILNGLVGLCLLVGGIRHREQYFVLEGVSAALCVLAAMATLVLVLPTLRSEEHTSELQSLMRISYAVFCLKKKKTNEYTTIT